MVDSSDRYALSQYEDFQGRIQILLVEFCQNLLSNSTTNDRLTHIAQDALIHVDEYKKRFPILVAAAMADEDVDANVDDGTLRDVISEVFLTLAGEEL